MYSPEKKIILTLKSLNRSSLSISSAMQSWRVIIVLTSLGGCKILARRSRSPPGVCVCLSIPYNVCSILPSSFVTSSRLRADEVPTVKEKELLFSDLGNELEVNF